MRIAEVRALLGVRSVIETPILEERKWGKVPGLDVDAVLVDLEDSVAPLRKEEARERVVEELRGSALAPKLRLTRPNHLRTAWGHDDLVAIAEAGVEYVVYPKVRTADELREAQQVLRLHGADPALIPVLETAQSLLECEQIVDVDGVVGLMVGPSDLSADTGIPVYDDEGSYNPSLFHHLLRGVLVAKSRRMAIIGGAFAPDVRDLDDMARRLWWYKRAGFTGIAAFYPPHLPLINRIFAPDDAAITDAEAIIKAYEAGLAEGRAAVQTDDGRAILVFDYEKAKALLATVRVGER